MLKIAIAGVGFMSWIHYLAYQRSTTAQLVAFCSRDPKKRSGDWRGIQGNFGPPGELIDIGPLQTYESLEQMLNDPQIDVIDICLPPHLHVEAACQALAAGKHVFCENRWGWYRSVRPDPGRCSCYDRQVLLPKCCPTWVSSSTPINRSWKAGLGGRCATLEADHLAAGLIPDFYDADKVGGPLIDLHVHDAPCGCCSACHGGSCVRPPCIRGWSSFATR